MIDRGGAAVAALRVDPAWDTSAGFTVAPGDIREVHVHSASPIPPIA